MDCTICDSENNKNVLFEDDSVKVLLALSPSTSGHIQIFPKKHYTILEQVPEEDLGKLMSYANKMSMILFELFKVHGTNIIINNGVPAGQKLPHFSVDVIPRRTDDGLKLDWELKQASPESLESMHRIIGEGMNAPSQPTLELPSPSQEQSIPTEKYSDNNSETSNDSSKKKTNYHHKFFERIP